MEMLRGLPPEQPTFSTRSQGQEKRSIVEQFLQEAYDCSLRQDPAQWYQRIRQICPSSRREGIHLRSASGALLSPSESLSELVSFYSQLFTDDTYTPRAIPRMRKVPFSVAELQAAIVVWLSTCMLSLRNAGVRPNHVTCLIPGTKQCSVSFPSRASRQRRQATSVLYASSIRYAQSSLAWLRTRPGKRSRTCSFPYHVMAILAIVQLRTVCSKYSNICADVKQATERAAQLKGSSRPMLVGGIQLCLDLSLAFVQVFRKLVEDSVQSAGFSPEVEAAILVWMHGGRYEIQHKGLAAEISCSYGTKQGLRGDPTNGVS